MLQSDASESRDHITHQEMTATQRVSRLLVSACLLAITLLLVRVGPATAQDTPPITAHTTQGDLSWSRLADLPSGRKSITWSTVALDGQVYVVGGLDEDGRPSSSLLRYDAGDDSWTELAPLPEGLWRTTAAAQDGKLYVFGGYTATDGFPFGATSTVYAYAPGTNTWTRLADAPRPRGTAAAVTMDDGIHVIGGVYRSDYAFHDIYHPDSDSWSEAPPLPTPRSGLAAIRRGDHIHVIGGYRLQQGVVAQDVHEVFDASSGTWTAAAPLPDARFGIAGSLLPDGRLIVLGGAEVAHGTRALTYDPESNAWTYVDDMPESASFAGVAPVEDGLVVAGGGADGLVPMDDARTSTRLLRFTPHETSR